ncbi:hypothetical protein GCM10011401_10640 [Nesterenkonia cremea]|uniref:Uncharacterized protein n=1 Tax=Nesterenkonia cremea TaxID=1882340 RepID=A0A917ARN7_9MICC|nr:hypothetical protein GCM10011401_10640 [Nesterenkonia cremea]
MAVGAVQPPPDVEDLRGSAAVHQLAQLIRGDQSAHLSPPELSPSPWVINKTHLSASNIGVSALSMDFMDHPREKGPDLTPGRG